MANPRQKRKARSSDHKVRVAKHVNSRLKKVTPLNFPAGLSELYNRRQTPTQNYKRLGLLSGKLDPRLSGGIEKDTNLSKNWLTKVKNPDEWDLREEDEDEENEEDEDEEEEEDEDKSVEEENTPQINSITQNSDKLAKGEGRIIRDADGKIIKVILGDEEDIEIMNNSEDPSSILLVQPPRPIEKATPWGDPLQPAPYEKPVQSKSNPEIVQPSVPQGFPYENPRMGKVPAKTDFVAQLEQISTSRNYDYANVMKNKQYLSDSQVAWIVKMIEKHGVENVSGMAKDLKLNTYQRTEGEIRYMISRIVK
ncbi:ribosome biogenesis protein Nop16 [Melampsora americana]|nr:ribosome biogenesis protein Nop16 [Melampsora americana]